jgi:hypothetical protein
VLFLAVVVALLVLAQPAGDDPLARQRETGKAFVLSWLEPGEDVFARRRLGLSVVVPEGWSVVHRPLSYCTDPVQSIALRGNGALVQIVESLSGGVGGFPTRPRRFALRGKPQFLACCPPADRKGWFIPFRDGRRGFYAYVYLSARGTRTEVLRILDSFQVAQRDLRP